LPPIVPTLRVAWEPTIAEASARAVHVLRIAALAVMSAGERPKRQVTRRVDAAQCLDSVNRDDVRGQLAPATGLHDQV
jgi:hypothetical protein